MEISAPLPVYRQIGRRYCGEQNLSETKAGRLYKMETGARCAGKTAEAERYAAAGAEIAALLESAEGKGEA